MNRRRFWMSTGLAWLVWIGIEIVAVVLVFDAGYYAERLAPVARRCGMLFVGLLVLGVLLQNLG